MPNPFDYLRSAFNAATTSVVPQEWIDPAMDAIDSPDLERSPMEARIRGFGAGAIQGLRDQLNPMEIAMALAGGGGLSAAAKAGKAATGASRGVGQMVRRAARPTLDILEDAPVKQIKNPSAGAVDDLIGELHDNLSRVPNSRTRPGMGRTPQPEGAGYRDPSFTPRGGEAAFNAGRPPLHSAAGGDGFHRTMLRRLGGRGEM